MTPTPATVLARRVAAEGTGTALLLLAVAGSGTMAAQIAPGSAAVALFALSIAAGGTLLALALAFGKLSGGHFNPAISVAAALMRVLSWRDAMCYMAAQIIGAFVGVAAAFLLFGDPLVLISADSRSGVGLSRSELVATFGLVAIYCGCARARPAVWPFALAGYVAAVYWFSAAPTLANPAIAIARAGMYVPSQIPWAWLGLCLAVQAFGTAACAGISRWLFEDDVPRPERADDAQNEIRRRAETPELHTQVERVAA